MSLLGKPQHPPWHPCEAAATEGAALKVLSLLMHCTKCGTCIVEKRLDFYQPCRLKPPGYYSRDMSTWGKNTFETFRAINKIHIRLSTCLNEKFMH